MTGHRGEDDNLYSRRMSGRSRYSREDRYGRGRMQLNNNMYMKGDEIKDDNSDKL